MGTYPIDGPRVFGADGAVEVTDDLLLVDHKFLKARLGIPLTAVAGAGPHDEATSESSALWQRDVRRFNVVATAFDAPSVDLVLTPPQRVAGFKYGSERFFHLTGRQRKQGIDVDVLGIGVDDPAGLLAELARKGVATGRSVAADLRAAVGEAAGHLAEARRGEVQRMKRRFGALAVVGTLVFALVLAARVALAADHEGSIDWAVVRRACALAAAVFVVTTAIVHRWPTRPRPTEAVETNRRRRRAYLLGLAMALVVTVGSAVAANAVGSDAALVAVGGLLGGVTGGVGAGWSLRALGRLGPTGGGGDEGPLSPPR